MRAPEPKPSDRKSSVADTPEVRLAAAAQYLIRTVCTWLFPAVFICSGSRAFGNRMMYLV